MVVNLRAIVAPLIPATAMLAACGGGLEVVGVASADRVVEAAGRACVALSAEGLWPDRRLLEDLVPARIVVEDVGALDLDGCACYGGETEVETGTIRLARHLASMAHEIAHLLEWRLDGRRSPDHRTAIWPAVGRAEVEYRRWLDRR